jgi:hypothetical protein
MEKIPIFSGDFGNWEDFIFLITWLYMSLPEDIAVSDIYYYCCRAFTVWLINRFSKKMYLKNGGE